MRILILFTALLGFSFYGKSQLAFYKTYSDQGYDVGQGICQLRDSSYLVTGSSSSFTSSKQAFIMQVDSMGNRLWSKNYGGTESDQGRRIFHVENDGIYVAGQSNSAGQGFFDAYFFKTDLNGNLLYEKHIGTPAYENIHDAVILPDTSFILVGETRNTSSENENIYLIRINKQGDTLWTKNFGTDGIDFAKAIRMLNDTTVIIGGSYYVEDSLTQKAMLIRMHIDGSVTWLKTFGNQGMYLINDLTIEGDEVRAVGTNRKNLSVLGNDSFFALYYSIGGDYFGLGSEINAGNYNITCIVKYGQNPDDYWYAFEVTNDPNLPTYEGGSDICINKYAAGIYWGGITLFPSDEGEDHANQMIATSDNGAILVGSSQNPQIGGSNALLVKIGANDYFPYSHTTPMNTSLVSVKEVKTESFGAYPNPACDFVVIKLPNNSSYKIVDIQGNILQEGQLSLGENKINTSKLESGSYFVLLNELLQSIKLLK